MSPKSVALAADVLELDYRLCELPSAQHRAGLAGMVLLARWLERNGHTGHFELGVRPDGAKLRFDKAGLASLFDEIFGADVTEREVEGKWPGATPVRTYEREMIDESKGKVTKKTVFVYEVAQPRGAFLKDIEGDEGPWLKLWRDFIWQVMRGKPTSRGPYNARAYGMATNDVEKLWKDLSKVAAGKEATINLSGTLYLGAADRTADDVDFLDNVKAQFLLLGWVFTASLYQVVTTDQEGKPDYQGFAVAVPDVSDLEAFCDHYESVLHMRPKTVAGLYPAAANIVLPAEGGLDAFWKLRQGLQHRAADIRLEDIVWGIEVIHVARAGNNIVLRQAFRLTPDLAIEARCQELREGLKSRTVRRLRMENLVSRRPWYAGFDRLCATRTLKTTQEDRFFRHDCKELLKIEISNASLAHDERRLMTETAHPPATAPYSSEACVFRLVRAYVSRRVKTKHGLSWDAAQADEGTKSQFNDAKAKVARDAFLAVRSRTGADFVEYFASTLCSMPQWLPEEDFVQLTRDLYADPDKIRTLTLIALSAQG